MAHVLIDGESCTLAEVHDCLRRWGLTVDCLPKDARARGTASRAECDAVIFLCEAGQGGSGAMDCHLKSVPPIEGGRPDGEELPAPMLVIGRGPLAETMGRHAHQLIPEIGPEGSHLKMALGLCLENQSGLGPAELERSNRDQQLHFLGHELRSPLTALKTALEVLQGDLGGVGGSAPEMESPASDRSRLRMLEIALRNVRRMHHAVEWSQALLKFEDSRPASALRQISVSQLGEELGQTVGNEVRVRGRDVIVECDADLLLHVAKQAIQAMRFGDPDLKLVLNLDAETAGTDRLQLEILCPESDTPSNDHAAESGGDLVSAGSENRESNHHLQRFADFLNPSESLVRASGEVRVFGGADEGFGLALTIAFKVCGSGVVTLVC
ncbi:MAG: hypothetical protein KOO60_07075 [Gemmatimonadales bacterium]|nr:hypothetical protein [Gemmatimonadales bacterium]